MTFVWCTIVTDDLGTTKGAAVLAHSIRAVGSAYPIWCIVPKGYPTTHMNFLTRVFDRVVVISPMIQLVTPTGRYNEPVKHSMDFTRWCVFNPEVFPVDKVMMLSPDIVMLHNCDELFELATPALTFTTPWMRPFGRQNRGFYNPYGPLKHGETVPFSKIKAALRSGEVALFSMVLLSPNQKVFNTLGDILYEHEKYGYGVNDRYILLLMETFIKLDTQPTHIAQHYNWIVGQTKWLGKETARTMQFYNGNPWYGVESLDEREEKIEQGRWQDNRDWWAIADKVMVEYDAADIFYPR